MKCKSLITKLLPKTTNSVIGKLKQCSLCLHEDCVCSSIVVCSICYCVLPSVPSHVAKGWTWKKHMNWHKSKGEMIK